DGLVQVEHRIGVVSKRHSRCQRKGSREQGKHFHRISPEYRHKRGTFTGVPSLGRPLSSTLPSALVRSRNNPPYFPLRSGATRTLNRSPRLRGLRVQASRLMLF